MNNKIVIKEMKINLFSRNYELVLVVKNRNQINFQHQLKPVELKVKIKKNLKKMF